MAKTIKKCQKNSSKKNKVKSTNLNDNDSKAPKKGIVLVNTCKKVSKKKRPVRINYSPGDLANALKAIDTGLSLRKAAAAYNVPIATLSRKKENPETSKQKTGPPPVFSVNEEQKIVDWILFRGQRGLPVTKTELLDSVEQYVKLLKKETPFIDNRPSRHCRAAVTDDDLKDWFEEQGKYLQEKQLTKIPPKRIFNCDETYVSLCPPSEKVLLDKGSRSAYKVVDSERKNFSEADILEHNTGDELKFDSNVLVADSQTGSLDTTSVITNITNVPTTTLTTPVMEKNSEPQINLTLSESVVSKENDSKSANEIFTEEKRIKVESSRKPKLPSAGTSDQWMQYHSKKENDEIIKKKNKNEKTITRTEKRIADERKKLQDQIKEIQQKIKEETR
ncbi:hypothetical protein EVAR_85654_1 [Eumeta japonica]|uniref:HTH psq-type domain-containing protein n=1 Tax=Eumeta variegata TaxID=151549 RepID=A0A4C1XWA4_EUMVA|nr:hypothetical protein EVAR_85654_1 [Eumeta japonica]